MKTKLRKNLLIYPKFQLTLIGINSFVLAGMFLVISFQISNAVKTLTQSGTDLHLEPTHPYFAFLHAVTHLLNTYLRWGFLACAVVSSIAILLVSHRVAGPMVRLRGYFKDISEKGSESAFPLKFRKGDFFTDIPPAVNSAFDKVLNKTPTA